MQTSYKAHTQKKTSFLMIMFTAFSLFLCVNLVSADLNDALVAWWTFEDDVTDSHGSHDGYVDGNPTYQEGIQGNAIDLDGTGDYVNVTHSSYWNFGSSNFTIAIWVNFTGIGGNRGFISHDNSGADSWRVYYGSPSYIQDTGEISLGGDSLVAHQWDLLIVVKNSTHTAFWQNGTLKAQAANADITDLTHDLQFGVYQRSTALGYYLFNGLLDEAAIWNRSLGDDEIADLWNNGAGITYSEIEPESLISVTLTSPSNGFTSSTIGLNFTGNYTASHANLTNATYYIWDSLGVIFNDTETILINGTVNGSIHEINNFTLETYTWNVFVCGENSTQAICNWSASNYTFTIGATADNETHVANVYETANERFEFNISLISGASLYLSKLYYNGTPYTATILNLGSDRYSTYKSIDIPTVASNYDNLTFFWSLTYEKADGTFLNQNLTTYTQTVNTTHFELCDATYTIPYLNFTTKNATNPFPNINATFKLALDYWLGTGDYKKNFSFENVSEELHSFNFCADPGYKTFYADAQIEFEGVGSSQNYHYLTNAILSNSTNLINLYLLDNTESTLTVLKVRDETQNPLPNITISIQLYDVGTDTYYTIGMAKTSFNGEDLVYLNWYDSLYKFVLTDDGEVIKTTSPYKISETPQIFEIVTEVINPFAKFADFIYSLTFNDATDNFILTFTKPSGLVDQGCLKVIKRTFKNDTIICDVCESSSSATLYCNIAAYGNGTFIATFYATGSFQVVDTYILLKNISNEIYDLLGTVDGMIYAFLFAGVCLAMFFVSPVLAVIGLMLGMLGAMILGFQPLEWSAFISMIVVGGFLIWFLKR